MGNVTSGENNEDLVDILKILGHIKTKRVERIFRAVDRGDYVLPDHRSEAYKDLSWKMENVHLSAPCIYTKVMEGLSLEPGLSFLNIGSGTGYLSTMAGLILSRHGTNHGIELNSDCMEYAYKKLEEFKQKSLALDEFDFCEPVFIQGNCLKLECTRKYDRVYCGAACPESHEAFIKQFVKIGGILVMPYKDHLLRIERIDTNSWKHKVMLPVLFAPLIMPSSNCNYNNNSSDDHDNTTDKVNDCRDSSLLLPFSEPLSLQELCRCEIRCQLHKIIWAEHPELEVNYPITGLNRTRPNAYPITAQTTLPRYVMPLYNESSDNSPYITLNDDYDDDDEDEDDDSIDSNDDEDNIDNNNDDDDDDDDNNNDNDVNNKDRSSKIRHRRNRKTRLFFCLEPSRLESEPNEEEEDEDEGNNDDDDDDDDDDNEIEQVTSFRVLKNVSPKKSILNIFNLDKSTINNDDNNKTKDQELSENAFQPSTSQYLSQGCSNNDNSQENSNDVLFTSAKESLDSLLCYSNSQINSDSQGDEETMDVDKEQQESTDENFQVVDGTKSSVLNPSTSTNNIRTTTVDNNEANSSTSGYQEILDASNGIDNNGDDSMECCLHSMKSRHQQKNNKWGISDHLNSAESHPSLSKRSKVNDTENNDENSRENRPHPRVCGYNVDIESLSSHMKKKISQLPLPVSLRLYVNYNRSL